MTLATRLRRSAEQHGRREEDEGKRTFRKGAWYRPLTAQLPPLGWDFDPEVQETQEDEQEEQEEQAQQELEAQAPNIAHNTTVQVQAALDDINLFFGWDLKKMSAEMIKHYAGLERRFRG